MLENAEIRPNYLKSIGGQKQWIISKRNCVPIVINKFSWDQFVLYKIPKSIDRKKMEDFHLRQLYSLPNTPKILSLDNSQQQKQFRLVLCQKAPYDFEKLMHWHTQNHQLLKLFLKIISVLQMLTKKYGYFDINKNMIRATKGPTPVIWINENQIQSCPQFPIQINQTTSANSINQQIQTYITLKLANFFKEYHPTVNLDLYPSQTQWCFNYTYDYIQKIIKSQTPDSFLALSSQNLVLNKNDRRLTGGKKNSSIPEFLRKQNSNKQSHITYNPKNSYGNIKNINKIKMRSIQKYQNIPMHLPLKTKEQSKYSNTPKAKNGGFMFLVDQPKIYSKTRIEIQKKKTNKYGFGTNCDSLISYDSTSNYGAKYIRSDKSIEISLEKQKKISDSSGVIKIKNNNQQFIQNLKKDQNKKFSYASCKTQAQKNICMKDHIKGKIRDSGRSFSTTAPYFSISSSGNRKQTHIEEDVSSSFSKNRQKLVSTFGEKTASLEQQLKRKQQNQKLKRSGKFAVKVSKIIQQNQQMLAQSPSRRSPKSPSIIYGKNLTQNSIFQNSQIQRQVSNLFCSGVFDPTEPKQISGIEKQLDDILFS